MSATRKRKTSKRAGSAKVAKTVVQRISADQIVCDDYRMAEISALYIPPTVLSLGEVKIHFDGRVEIEQDAGLEQVARDFWTFVSHHFPVTPPKAAGSEKPYRWIWEEDLINTGSYTEQCDDEPPGDHPGIRNVTPLYLHPPGPNREEDRVEIERIIADLRHAASDRSDRLQQTQAIDNAIAFLAATHSGSASTAKGVDQ